MAILKSCCCCSNLRSGAIACGIYTLVLSLINEFILLYHLFTYNDSTGMKVTPSMNDTTNLDDWIHSGQAHSLYSVKLTGWNVMILLTLLTSFVLCLASIFLIIGVYKNITSFLVVWIIAIIMNIIMDTLTIVFEVVVFGVLTLHIIQMVIWLGLTTLNVYCTLCVISQVQELRAGRGHSRDNEPRVTYRDHVREVYISQGPIFIGANSRGCTLSARLDTTSGADNPILDMSSSVMLVRPPDYPASASDTHSPRQAGQPPRYSWGPSSHLTTSSHISDNLDHVNSQQALLSDTACEDEVEDREVRLSSPSSPPPPYTL